MWLVIGIIAFFVINEIRLRILEEELDRRHIEAMDLLERQGIEIDD